MFMVSFSFRRHFFSWLRQPLWISYASSLRISWGTGIPTNEVVQEVVGEGRGGAAGGTAGDVAPIVVVAGINLPCFVGAGSTTGIEAGQLMRLAVAVEVLLLRTGAVERPLPELSQVPLQDRTRWLCS